MVGTIAEFYGLVLPFDVKKNRKDDRAVKLNPEKVDKILKEFKDAVGSMKTVFEPTVVQFELEREVSIEKATKEPGSTKDAVMTDRFKNFLGNLIRRKPTLETNVPQVAMAEESKVVPMPVKEKEMEALPAVFEEKLPTTEQPMISENVQVAEEATPVEMKKEESVAMSIVDNQVPSGVVRDPYPEYKDNVLPIVENGGQVVAEMPSESNATVTVVEPEEITDEDLFKTFQDALSRNTILEEQVASLTTKMEAMLAQVQAAEENARKMQETLRSTAIKARDFEDMYNQANSNLTRADGEINRLKQTMHEKDERAELDAQRREKAAFLAGQKAPLQVINGLKKIVAQKQQHGVSDLKEYTKAA